MESKINNSDDYNEKFMKTKFNSGLYLPLEMHSLVIVSRSFSMLVIIIIQKYFSINLYEN